MADLLMIIFTINSIRMFSGMSVFVFSAIKFFSDLSKIYNMILLDRTFVIGFCNDSTLEKGINAIISHHIVLFDLMMLCMKVFPSE